MKDTNEQTTDELLSLLKGKQDFYEYLEEKPVYLEKTLSELLQDLLEEKKETKAEVIDRSQLDRVYAYQIFSGVKSPSRDKLVALGYGLGLSLEEMQRVLKASGISPLYVKKKRDSILMFGFEKRLRVQQVNELLFEMKEEILR